MGDTLFSHCSARNFDISFYFLFVISDIFNSISLRFVGFAFLEY